jgi:hypothetical protein
MMGNGERKKGVDDTLTAVLFRGGQPPAFPPTLSRLGALLLTLTAFASIMAAPAYIFISVLSLLLAWIVARVFFRHPLPRRYPPASALLVGLLAAAALLFIFDRPMVLLSPLILAVAVAFAGAGLVRSHSGVRMAAVGVMTGGAVAAPVAWISNSSAGSTAQHSTLLLSSDVETGWLLLILVAGFFPYLLTLRGPRRLSGIAFVVLIAAGLASPFALKGLAASLRAIAYFPLHDPVRLLLLAAMVFTAGGAVRLARKEAGRWNNSPELSTLLLAVGPLALLAIPMFLAGMPFDSLRGFTLLGAVSAVSLAARQRRIEDDPTRQPRSRPAPWWAPLEEAQIVLRSLAATASAAMQRPRISQLATPRRILAPTGPVHVPYRDDKSVFSPIVMHLHSNRWEGAFTTCEVVRHYAALGARSVILTDHNRITRSVHPMAGPPSYEHGWGPHNHHALVLGASKTAAERHAFGGRFPTRIETLGRLRKIGRFLILAHPGSGQAWPGEEVAGLDYDAIELFNKSSDDTATWDEALTSGLLVWGTAGDDNHDLRSRHQTGKRYIMVDSEGLEDGAPFEHDLLFDRLRQGQFYAVRLTEPPEDRRITRSLPEDDAPGVVRITETRDGMNVQFDRSVERAVVYGPDRTVLQELSGTETAKVSVPDTASYARLEVVHGRHHLAFNPAFRLDAGAVPPWNASESGDNENRPRG